MDIKPEDAAELERMASSTARCIDFDRAKVIAGVIEGDLKRAYLMGQRMQREAGG